MIAGIFQEKVDIARRTHTDIFESFLSKLNKLIFVLCHCKRSYLREEEIPKHMLSFAPKCMFFSF